MRDALYYPHIDVIDEGWLKTSLLFHEKLCTIVPSSILAPYQTPSSSEAFKSGLLSPIRCDLDPEMLTQISRRAEKVFHSADLWHGWGRPEALQVANPSDDVDLLEGKFASSFISDIRDRFNPDDGRPKSNEKVTVPRRFADQYMTLMANEIAFRDDLEVVTSRGVLHGISMRELVEDATPDGAYNAIGGMLLTLTFDSLSVDPETPLRKLIRFRERRMSSLLQLSAALEALEPDLSDCESAHDAEGRVRGIYNGQLKPALENLAAELQDQTISAVWQGFRQTAVVSTGAGSLLGIATQLPATAIVAAGAALTVADILVQRRLATRRLIRSSPYAYLIDVQKKFSTRPLSSFGKF